MKNFSKIIFLLVFSLQAAQQREAAKCTVQTINTVHEFADILRSHPRVIINFFGACGHCPPGIMKFNQFVESCDAKDINFYEFKVNDKPEVLEQYQIELRPTVMGFVNGVEAPKRYVRDELTKDNFLKLVQYLLSYRAVMLK